MSLFNFETPRFFRKSSCLEEYWSGKFDDGEMSVSFSSSFPRFVYTDYVLLIDDLVSVSLANEYSAAPEIVKKIEKRERQVLEGALMVIVRSENGLKNVRHLAPLANAISLIPPGVLRYQLSQQDKSQKLNAHRNGVKTINIGFIGKDYKRKNLRLVTSIVKILNKISKVFSFNLLYVGSNDIESRERLTSYGRLFEQDQAKWEHFWKSVNVGILLSENEALGLSSIEFQYNGVPSIVWDNGGLPSTLVKENSGLLLDYNNNPVVLAETILSWFDSGGFEMALLECYYLDYDRDWEAFVLNVFSKIHKISTV
jgi:glycosyltransferase involved in cell wall biosynthesis